MTYDEAIARLEVLLRDLDRNSPPLTMTEYTAKSSEARQLLIFCHDTLEKLSPPKTT